MRIWSGSATCSGLVLGWEGHAASSCFALMAAPGGRIRRRWLRARVVEVVRGLAESLGGRVASVASPSPLLVAQVATSGSGGQHGGWRRVVASGGRIWLEVDRLDDGGCGRVRWRLWEGWQSSWEAGVALIASLSPSSQHRRSDPVPMVHSMARGWQRR
jgi:hypothetical protein